MKEALSILALGFLALKPVARRLLTVFVLLAIGGCVWVGRQGSYSRTEHIDQSGSNKVQKLEIKP